MILSRSSVVGIDLGNEHSVVCIARNQKLEVLTNAIGGRKTPTLVAFNASQRIIGEGAINEVYSNAQNCITSIKTLLGRSWEDPAFHAELKHMEYAVQKDSKGGVEIKVNYDGREQIVSPMHAVAMYLKQIKVMCESAMNGQTADDCVIACPSYWNNKQRLELVEAAKLCGMNVVRLMNEATAIAANYGMLRALPKEEKFVMFVDIGLVACTVGIASVVEGKVKMLSCCADPQLGGRDFEDVTMRFLAEKIQAQYNLDVLSNKKARIKLRREAKRVTKVLSANTSAKYEVENIMNDKDVKGNITREELEARFAPLLARLSIPAKEALEAAKVKAADLLSIEVVGGASRIPCVQKVFSNEFGKDPSFTCDLDESIAKGCCLQCALLSPSFKMKTFEIVDISSFPMKLHWEQKPGGDNTKSDDAVLFKRFNPIPSTKEIALKGYNQNFEMWVTYADPQTYTRELGFGSQRDPLVSRFVCEGLSEHKNPEACKIKVRVKLDGHGITHVVGASIEVKVEEEAAAQTPLAATEAPAKEEDKDKREDTEDKKEEKKKNKIRKCDLNVRSLVLSVLSDDERKVIEQTEKEMCELDNLLHGAEEAKNAVESYILDFRSELDYSLKEFVDSAAVEDIKSKLAEAEDWMLDQDESDTRNFINVLKEKLAELKMLGQPISDRKHAAAERAAAVDTIRKLLVDVQSKAATPIPYDALALAGDDAGQEKENTGSVNADKDADKENKDKQAAPSLAKANAEAAKAAEDKRLAFLKDVSDAETWLGKVVEEQKKKALKDSPAFTPEQVNTKMSDMKSKFEAVKETLKRFNVDGAVKKEKEKEKEKEANDSSTKMEDVGDEPLKALM